MVQHPVNPVTFVVVFVVVQLIGYVQPGDQTGSKTNGKSGYIDEGKGFLSSNVPDENFHFIYYVNGKGINL
jgi:hypothetical protein